jgi:hypothetical protein
MRSDLTYQANLVHIDDLLRRSAERRLITQATGSSEVSRSPGRARTWFRFKAHLAQPRPHRNVAG